MKRFHFSLGNSSEGPLGFCASVYAETPEEAVESLRNALPNQSDVRDTVGEDIDYVAVYFNPAVITVADIDDIDEAEDA